MSGSDFASMRTIETNYDQREDQVSGPRAVRR
jgi:hypothetical protein